MPPLALAIACTLCVLAGKPTAAYAEVDLFNNKTQFLAHHYSSHSDDTQNGANLYWRWIDFDSVDIGSGMTDVMGLNTSNYQERYYTGGLIKSEIKDALVLKTTNYVYDGQDLDLSIQSRFPAGMKVYLVNFGYIMAGKVENISKNTGTGNLTYYQKEIHFNSRWWKGSFQVLGHNVNGWDALQLDDDGGILFSETYTQLTFRWTMKRTGGGTDSCDYFAIDRPMLIWSSESAQMQGYVDEIMSTNGADTVGNQQVTDAQNIVQNMTMLDVVEQVDGSYHDALFTTEEQSTLTFPGLSLPICGSVYTIPSYSFDIWQFAPVFEQPVRWITTFLFVSAFFESLYNMWWKAVIGVVDWDEYAVREMANELGVEYE